MKKIYLALLYLAVLVSTAHAQVDSPQSFVAKVGGKAIEFFCNGTAGSSRVIVRLPSSTGSHMLLTYQLDDTDDCSQVTWQLQRLHFDSSSALVMLNPGRMGLNAQLSTFLIRGNVVSFSGDIPVRAESISDTEYRSFSTDAEGVWERTDSLEGDKFAIVKELNLMESGSICVDRLGLVVETESCEVKRIFARPEKPICVEYRKHRGRVVPIGVCSVLLSQYGRGWKK